MRCNGSNWAVYSPGSWDGFRNDVWALWAGVIMRLEHHLVGGYVRYISPYIIIIIILSIKYAYKELPVANAYCKYLFKSPHTYIQKRQKRLWQNVLAAHIMMMLALPSTNTIERVWLTDDGIAILDRCPEWREGMLSCDVTGQDVPQCI